MTRNSGLNPASLIALRAGRTRLINNVSRLHPSMIWMDMAPRQVSNLPRGRGYLLHMVRAFNARGSSRTGLRH